ncbi:MAG: transposase [Ruminococcus sp.]
MPGISHFSGTSILAELGDICNYTKAAQIIKFAGVAPYHYESSQFTAQHTAITKKVPDILGKRYIRLFFRLLITIRSLPLITTKS